MTLRKLKVNASHIHCIMWKKRKRVKGSKYKVSEKAKKLQRADRRVKGHHLYLFIIYIFMYLCTHLSLHIQCTIYVLCMSLIARYIISLHTCSLTPGVTDI